MKKKILLITLVVCLVFGGISGVIYASGEHESLQGQKLVGVVSMGTITNTELGDYRIMPYFQITNSDCENPITIKRLSVLDGDGNPIYEGPLVTVAWNNDLGYHVREIITTMSPHQIIQSFLHLYMWIGGDSEDWTNPNNWSTDPAYLDGPTVRYTFEITWEAKSSTAPLIGWLISWTSIKKVEGEYTTYRDQSKQSPMINVEQK